MEAVNSNFLKRFSKTKRSAPAYSRRLYQVRGFLMRSQVRGGFEFVGQRQEKSKIEGTQSRPVRVTMMRKCMHGQNRGKAKNVNEGENVNFTQMGEFINFGEIGGGHYLIL